MPWEMIWWPWKDFRGIQYGSESRCGNCVAQAVMFGGAGGWRRWFIWSTEQDNTSFRRHVRYVTNSLVKATHSVIARNSWRTDVPNTASTSSNPEYLSRPTWPDDVVQCFSTSGMGTTGGTRTVVWWYSNQNLYLSFCRWNFSCVFQQSGPN